MTDRRETSNVEKQLEVWNLNRNLNQSCECVSLPKNETSKALLEVKRTASTEEVGDLFVGEIMFPQAVA